MKPSTSLFVYLRLFAVWLSIGTPAFAQAPAEAIFTPPGTPASLHSWVEQNRYIEVNVGRHQQDYREQDTLGLTTDGILDTEKGNQNQTGLAIRWQTSDGWLLQLQAQRQSGATNYNGYLQSGNGTLTPYNARSGNVADSYAAQLGYALNSTTWTAVPEGWQLVPIVQVSQHGWQRNLEQYSETYRYTAWTAGAMLQWHPRAGTVLEVLALSGRTDPASVSVQALNFATEQPGANMQQWHIAISQDMGLFSSNASLAGWRVIARYTQSTATHGESPVVNGLQAPPNQQDASAWVLGVQKQF